MLINFNPYAWKFPCQISTSDWFFLTSYRNSSAISEDYLRKEQIFFLLHICSLLCFFTTFSSRNLKFGSMCSGTALYHQLESTQPSYKTQNQKMPLCPWAARDFGVWQQTSPKSLSVLKSTLLFLALLWDRTSSILSKHCPKWASNTLPTDDSNSTDLLGEHVAATLLPSEAPCALGGRSPDKKPRIALRLCLENRAARSKLHCILKQQP